MLPLSLLNTAQGHPMLVELKNGNYSNQQILFLSGETYNGHLVNCDTWMNINLREVICTSSDGEKFWRMPEIYIRGNIIKYLRVPDQVIDMVKDDQKRQKQSNGFSQRGSRGGSGRGRGRGRGGRGRGH